MPSHPSLITSWADVDTCMFTCVCVCVIFAFISAAIVCSWMFFTEIGFRLWSSQASFESGLWNPFGSIMGWAEKVCGDSLVFSSASSHYTAEAHTLYGAACPADQSRFFTQSAGSWLLHTTLNSMAGRTILPCIYICWAVDQFSV